MSQRDLILYFLRLGATGFGGPVALVGHMQRDLVEGREWFAPEEYREGLALAQLAPGPLAAQLAMYLGWARGGVRGAALTGLAFVLPSFVMATAIAAAYVRFGGLPWMEGAFYGIGAAAIAIIARSALKLTRITLGADRWRWALFAAAALVTACTESEMVWIFVGAGVVMVAVRSRPWAGAAGVAFVGLPMGLALPQGTLWQIAWYFTEAGAFVFGSGLAIVPFLHAGVVHELRWLDERQFLDAVAVAMITPGPVVITVAFIGYLVAGFPGAVVAAVAVFLPCFLFTVIPAPHFQRLSRSGSLKAFVDGVTAAATGAIAGAAFVLGRRALVDLPTVGLALAAWLVLAGLRRVPEPVVIGAAGLAGFLIAGSGLAVPPTQTARAQVVVFVCEHGSAKSLVAASFFDRMARERGSGLRAISRGTAPDEAVPPGVVASLRGDGFDVATFRPRGLAKADLAGAKLVVAIGVDPGNTAGVRVERWDDIPPVSTRYPEARAAIRSRLERLLRELDGGPP